MRRRREADRNLSNSQKEMEETRVMLEKTVRERIELEAKLKQTEHEFTILRRHREKMSQEMEVYRRSHASDIMAADKASVGEEEKMRDLRIKLRDEKERRLRADNQLLTVSHEHAHQTRRLEQLERDYKACKHPPCPL